MAHRSRWSSRSGCQANPLTPLNLISDQALNNVIEADHGKLKQLIRPVRGFKSLKTAYATIKGFEVMRALHKGQAALWQYGGGIMGEVRLIERNFGTYTG